jgi:ferric-dicitrate binding protein FerR (iron transport regulator)
MSQANNIWNNGNSRLTDEMLQAYLDGKLSAEKLQEVEQWLADSGMEADALEGLKSIPAKEINNITTKLNLQLEQHIRKQPRRRTKAIKDNYWAWVAVIIVLLLCIIGYWVLRMANA